MDLDLLPGYTKQITPEARSARGFRVWCTLINNQSKSMVQQYWLVLSFVLTNIKNA